MSMPSVACFPTIGAEELRAGPLRNEFGLICKPLRIGCITQKFLNGVEIRAFWDDPAIEVEDLPEVPDMPGSAAFLLR